MSDLKGYRKVDLIALAEELGVEILPSDKVKAIIEKIEKDPDYDRELALAQIKLIVTDREAEKARELETERMEAERVERERIRQHELEKAKIAAETETNSIASSVTERPQKVALKSLMQKFCPEKSDMALFLNLFQRQASKLNLDDEEMITNLLALLPVDIAELILREPAENINNFEQVKEILLDRFKLSPEAYRTKFTQHQRRTDASWRDMIFELSSYLQGWLEGIKVESYEDLKKLMIADQIKRRVPGEIKDHFIDIWSRTNDPYELAKKLDEYEAVKKPIKKTGSEKFNDRKTDRPRTFEQAPLERKDSRTNWRERDDRIERSKIFEKRNKPACFHCGSLSHFKYNCPELENNGTSVERINSLVTNIEFDASFYPYLSKGKLNGKAITILHDSGSSCDLVSRNLINNNQLTGEVIWIRQPLDNSLHCLPIAQIDLEIRNVGVIKTKAAVLEEDVIMSHYLLGNKSQKLIENLKNNSKRTNATDTTGSKIRKKFPRNIHFEQKKNFDKRKMGASHSDIEGEKIRKSTIETAPQKYERRESTLLSERGQRNYRRGRQNEFSLRKVRGLHNRKYLEIDNLISDPEKCNSEIATDRVLDEKRSPEREIELERISDANLRIKMSKCQFAHKNVKYLDHRVGDGRRTPSETKIKAITDFPIPRSKTEFRRLTGRCNNYSKYVRGYASLSRA